MNKTQIYTLTISFEDGCVFGVEQILITSSGFEVMKALKDFSPLKYLVDKNENNLLMRYKRRS